MTVLFPHPAMTLLARETRSQRGPAPREIDGTPVARDGYLLRGDSFLLHTRDGLALHYKRGAGVTVDGPDDADPKEIALWLNGSVYAAVAAINGLMPLHASAVAHEGRVYAFTGQPGAGKSTLAAGLGRAGLPLFCDDTLVVDLSGSGPITGLPGHKRLKLWPEGAVLAGADPREQVASVYPKYFAEPAAGVIREPLPLAELIFLEQGDETAIHAIDPGERIGRLQDDHYTAMLFQQATALTRAERFAQLAAIAARMPMRRFVRPFKPERFEEGLDGMVRHIRGESGA